MKLSDFNKNDSIVITAKTENNELKFDASIIKILRDNVAIIDIHSEENYRFNFDNVQLNIEYNPGDDVPFIWRTARILNIKNQYVLQVNCEGVRFNRRSCYRLPIGKMVYINIMGKQTYEVMLKDISLSGFSIIDRHNEIDLYIGNDACIQFEELGYKIKLIGRVVRITEYENKKVYGFELRNLCNDLSPYIALKQQKNRIQKKINENL